MNWQVGSSEVILLYTLTLPPDCWNSRLRFSETVQQIVKEVEERLAVLLGVPIPTAGERVLEGRRLSVIGKVGKLRRPLCTYYHIRRQREY